MKASFKFLFAAGALCVLLLTNCGPGAGTNGRTGDYDKHNKLEEHHHRDTTDVGSDGVMDK